MAISAADRYYVAETVPSTIRDIGRALCTAFGRPPDAAGDKGNLVHDSGYHRSERWLRNSPDSRRRDQDASLRGDLNRSADPNAVSAFDFTPGSTERMILITRRVHAAAKRRDPRVANLAEFAGTLDGRTVVTFRCSDGGLLAPFDKSHLWHVHGSIYRARSTSNHTGIIAVMLGDEEDDMSLTAAQNNALAEAWATVASLRDGGPVAKVDTNPGGPNWLVEQIRHLAAAAAADATRDAAMATTVTQLAAAVNQLAGGDPTGAPIDTVRILAAIREATEQTRQMMLRIDELEAELEQRRQADAAAARAAADRLDDADGPARA